MKWAAIPLALIAVACAGGSWQEMPVVADLKAPQPCRSNGLAGTWTDSLPIVADSAQQHVIAGGAALQFPADMKLESRTGLVRARFVIDTAGRVLPGSGIIEAYSDQEFAQAVCYALPSLTFEPVVLDGRKTVAGLVHVPFIFRLR